MFKIRGDLCAFDRDNWNRDKEKFDCPSATNVYHCIVDERNRSGEICIQPVWVQTGYCPEYNTDANTVDTVLCDQSAGCPEDPFQSNEVYQYPVCINKTYIQPTAEEVDAVYSPLPFAIGISVGIIVAIIFVIAIVCYIRRRQKPGRRQKEEVPLHHRSEVPFYKTSAFHKASNFLQDGGQFLCLRGRWGSGKTTTAKWVYMSVTKRKPVVIEDIAEFDVNSCTDCVIIEEPFLKHLSEVAVENMMFKIKTLCSKIGTAKDNFAIFTFSDEEWKQFSHEIKKMLLALKNGPFLDICLNYDNLSPGDRNQILHSIFDHYNPTTAFRKVEKVATIFSEQCLGYAETCTLLSRCRISQINVGPFLFSNLPLLHLKLYLEKMCKSSEEMERSKFVMLVFMSLNQGKKDLNKSNTELFIACDLSPGKFQSTSIIPEEFVLRDGEGVYILQHDVIQRMVLVVFGTHHFEKLVRFSSWNELPDWIKEKTRLNRISKIKNTFNDIQPILEVSHEQMTELRNKCESNPETRVSENSLLISH